MALVLLFDSGLVSETTAELSNFTQLHVANVVGVTVGVAPNDVNQLTARITELETELTQKERLIAVNLRDNESGTGFDKSTFFLSAILFILLVLIVLNYALDYNRGRSNRPQYYDKNALPT